MRLTIGAKLAIFSGFGILLVCGMVASQWMNIESIGKSIGAVEREQKIFDGISAAQRSMLQLEVSIRDIKLSDNADLVLTSVESVRSAAALGQQALNVPINIALKPDVLKDIQTALGQYADLTIKFASLPLSDRNRRTAGEENSIASQMGLVRHQLGKAVDESLANARRFTEEARAVSSDAVDRATVVGLVFGLRSC